MSWKPLEDVMGEIETRQNDLDAYAGRKYRYGVYEPGTTFLRYLITNFKLQFYSTLQKKYGKLDVFLPYCNIYFLVRDSKSSQILIYPTEDQVKAANHRLRENSSWFFEKDFGKYGLAADVFKKAKNDKSFKSLSDPDWIDDLAAMDGYKDLEKELIIYRVDKKEKSILYVYALKHVEIIRNYSGT